MLAEFILTGLLAGYLAGFLGIGGGFVIVPALTLILSREAGLEPYAIHLAVATSLATMLLTSASSIWAHQRRKAINWGLVRKMALGLAIGAIAGAWLADRLPADKLGFLFGALAILAGLNMALGRSFHSSKPLPGPPGLFAVSTLFGGLSSLVGIGGGALTGPWQMWHGIRAQQAVATSAACGYPIALSGTLSFVLLGQNLQLPEPLSSSIVGYVHLPAFTAIALASALAAPLGAATVHRLPAALVKRFFGVFLVVVGLKMMVGF